MAFLRLKGDKPIKDRDDVWGAEINLKSLSITRRKKLVKLLTLSSNTVKDKDGVTVK